MVLMFAWSGARAAVTVPVLALSVAIAGCAGGNTAEKKPHDGHLSVVAAIYPLAYAAQQVGGKWVSVSTLAASGVEPHEQELSAKQVGEVEQADVVVYVTGLAGAVDAAVSQSSAAVVDALASIGAHKRANDPHLWLNPLRLADVGDALATQFSASAPDHAAAFKASAVALRSSLAQLDGQIRNETANCANRLLVTTHTAFGYFAGRYNFRQVSILGADPESEPTPATLARVIELVKSHGIKTLYGESGHTSKALNTVARETGASVRLLQTLEAPASNTDYFSAMQANAAIVSEGQGCQAP